MNFDDVIYVALLVFCILFGHIYRQIENGELKKWYGTGIGIFIILIVSGLHVFHTIIFLVLGSGIFLFIDVR